MKTGLILRASFTLLTGGSFAMAEMHTWTLQSGATVEGEIVDFPNAQSVKVKKPDGKFVTLPDAYLTEGDRTYAMTERAKLWKEASIDKVLGTTSAGRYKKCSVTGKDVTSPILLTLLPSQVESVLTKRQQEEDRIAALNSQIQKDQNTEHQAKPPAGAYGRRTQNSAKVAATYDEAMAKTNLIKLKSDYAETLKKTKPITTLLIKNTGLVYEGLQVWECQSPKR